MSTCLVSFRLFHAYFRWFYSCNRYATLVAAFILPLSCRPLKKKQLATYKKKVTRKNLNGTREHLCPQTTTRKAKKQHQHKFDPSSSIQLSCFFIGLNESSHHALFKTVLHFQKFKLFQKLSWKNKNTKILPLFQKPHSFVTVLLLVISQN